MKTRSNTPHSIHDENAGSIYPGPPLRPHVIFADDRAAQGVRPSDPPCHQITDEMQEVGGREPNRHAGRKTFFYEQGADHHDEGETDPERKAMRPARVASGQRQMRVQQIRRGTKDSQRDDFTVRENLIPVCTPVRPLDHTRDDHREKSMGNGVHGLVFSLTVTRSS